jgi:hypothetical protein
MMMVISSGNGSWRNEGSVGLLVTWTDESVKAIWIATGDAAMTREADSRRRAALATGTIFLWKGRDYVVAVAFWASDLS